LRYALFLGDWEESVLLRGTGRRAARIYRDEVL